MPDSWGTIRHWERGRAAGWRDRSSSRQRLAGRVGEGRPTAACPIPTRSRQARGKRQKPECAREYSGPTASSPDDARGDTSTGHVGRALAWHQTVMNCRDSTDHQGADPFHHLPCALRRAQPAAVPPRLPAGINRGQRERSQHSPPHGPPLSRAGDRGDSSVAGATSTFSESSLKRRTQNSSWRRTALRKNSLAPLAGQRRPASSS